MSDNAWSTKEKIIWKLCETDTQHNFFNTECISREFHHYTSLPTLFEILESDSLWASNVRFSNDEMEDKILKTDETSIRDDYMICFCNEKDMLSQWRGYCYDGGASIKFQIQFPRTYSILHADYDSTKKYFSYENVPLPVVYVSEYDMEDQDMVQRAIKSIRARISADDILPYLKNGKFYEEKELRLVFSNVRDCFSKCVRFRMLSNGAKVPYLVIKVDDVGKVLKNCMMNIDQYTNEKFQDIINNREVIWIEEGEDQEMVYNEIMERIKRFKDLKKVDDRIPVYCKGHLPIESITVAPTADRARVAEQIRRFCRSKYWLRGVIVEESTIPYFKPQK